MDGIEGNLHGILTVGLHVDGHPDLLGQHAQLLHGSRTIDVACSQQGFSAAFGLEHIGQFAGKGGLTGTVETCHEDYGRASVEVQLGRLAAHELCQLVVDDLDHHLLGLDGSEHVLSQGLLLDGVGKLLGDLVIDVGIQQCATHVLQRFRYVYLCDFALALQYLE